MAKKINKLETACRRFGLKRISLEHLANFCGYSADQATFVIAEAKDEDGYDVIPAVYFKDTNQYLDLSIGRLCSVVPEMKIYGAAVLRKKNGFIFIAKQTRDVRILSSQLIYLFGTDVIV